MPCLRLIGCLALTATLALAASAAAQSRNRNPPHFPDQNRPSAPGGNAPFAGSPESLRNLDTPSWVDVQIHLRAVNGAYAAAIMAALERTGELHRKSLVLVPQPFPYEGSNPNAHDYEVFLEAVRRQPDKLAFLGGAKLNALLQSTPAASVTPEIKARFIAQANKTMDDGARGFGELAILHLSHFAGHPYESVVPDHPLLVALADVAGARHALIALHMEAVENEMALPPAFEAPPNPKRLNENISAFERLVEHNPAARIVWLHAGWDNTGQKTPALLRRLLSKHANLYVTLKFMPAKLRDDALMTGAGINPDWLALLREFPDRFMLGSDSFFAAPGTTAPTVFMPAPMLLLLSRLPRPLAERLAFQNAELVYGLTPQR